MKKTSVTTPVKGGWVTRDAQTGRFKEVRTIEKASKVAPRTQSLLKETSTRRNAALTRLANR